MRTNNLQNHLQQKACGLVLGFFMTLFSSSAFSQLTVTISAQINVSCPGGSDAQLTATVTPGTSNYTYVWSNGSTTSGTSSLTNSITGLIANSYTVTVTDNLGASGIASATVTEPFTPFTISADNATTICPTGSVSITPDGGFTSDNYRWFNPNHTENWEVINSALNYKTATANTSSNRPDIAITSNGTTYIVYKDFTTSDLKIVQYKNEIWTDIPVATLNFSGLFDPQIEVNPITDQLYLLYAKSGTGYVSFWNGTSWTSLPNISSFGSYSGKMKFNSNGDIYIAHLPSNKLAVKKYDGSSWSSVGNSNIATVYGSRYIDLEINNQDSLMLVYGQQSGNPVKAVKLSGSTWVDASNGLPATRIFSCGITSDCNGEFITANRNQTYLNAYKFDWNANTWAQYGSPNLMGHNVYYVSMDKDELGDVYIGCSVSSVGTVLKYVDTDWVPVVQNQFTTSTVNFASFDVNKYGDIGYSYINYSALSNFKYYMFSEFYESQYASLDATLVSNEPGNYQLEVAPKGCMADTSTNQVTINVNYPEIDVQFQGVSIADEDNTPTLSDSTHMGYSALGASLQRTYTITNSGICDLTLDLPINILGDHAANFTISAPPNATIAIGDSTHFTVQFNANTYGLNNGTIVITNDDENEGTYRFDIMAYAIDLPMTLAIDTFDVICSGGSSGKAISTPYGGYPPYIYSWNNGQTTSSISALTAGNYSLTVTDFFLNSLVETTQITEPLDYPAPTISADNTELCVTPTANFSIDGGQTALTYCWTETSATTSWNVLDNSLKTGTSDVNSVAIDDNGIIYAAYEDTDNGNRLTVKKFENNAWSVVGTVGFSASSISRANIALSPSGVPYVFYVSGSSGLISYWDGSTWQSLPSVSATYGKLRFTPAGDLYVIHTPSNKISVSKYNGASWDLIGTSNIGTVYGQQYLDLAVNDAGDAYVAFADGLDEFKVKVRKLDSGSWTAIQEGISSTSLSSTAIELDHNNNLIIAYSSSSETGAYRFNGTRWDRIGSIINHTAIHHSLDTDVNGNIYLGFRNQSGGSKGIVYKFNGSSWTALGTNFTNSGHNYCEMAVNNSGAIAFGYSGLSGNSGKFVVESYNPTYLSTLNTLSVTATGTYALEIANGGCSKVSNSISITNNPAEIEVKGNGITISNNDVTPSASDSTVLASALLVGDSVSTTYTLFNSGVCDLAIGSISISGAQAGDFSIASAPLATIIGGSSSSFTIQYKPQNIGTSNATISFTTNDGDENPFSFDIEGSSVLPPPIPPNGTCDGVLNFDGGNDRVNLANSINPTTAITLEAWVKTDAIGARQTVIDKAYTSNSGPYYSYHLEIRANGQVYFPLSLNGTLRTVQTTDAITAGQWYHLAATYDGSTMLIYIDGVQKASSSRTGTISSYNSPLLLGNHNNSSLPFTGDLDEVRIWDIARSATDIDTYKDSIISGNTPGLKGYWNFNRLAESDTLLDASINGINGLLINMDIVNAWNTEDGISLPTISDIVTTNASCNGGTDGTITISTNGGVSPFQYSADAGISFQAGNTFTDSDGIYDMVVEDVNGCQALSQTEINEDIPEIQVKGAQVLISNMDNSPSPSDSTFVGSIAKGNSIDVKYEITNNGQCDLVLSGPVSLSGPEAGDFTVISSPSSPISSGSSTSFTVRFLRSTKGTSTATVTIASNDPSQSSYSFDIQGIANPLPPGGVCDGVIDLNGIDQTIAIDHDALLKPSSAITIEAWVFPTDISTNTYYEIYRKEDGSDRHLFSFQNSGTILSFGLKTGGSYAELDVPINANDYVNQWVHLAATYDGSVKRIYRNGVEIGNVAASGNIGTGGNSNAYIGSSIGSNEFFEGRMDEIRVWSVARSATDINNFNEVTLSGSEAGLIGYWNFDNPGETDVVADHGVNNLDGTVINMANWTNSQGVSLPTISSIVTTNVACYGNSDGSIAITSVGGTGALEYSVDNGSSFQANSNFSTLPEGTYSIIVKDASGCQASSNTILSQPTAINTSISSFDVSCHGGSNGSTVIIVNGGTSPYTYLWSEGSTTNNLVNLAASTLSVTVTDQLACSEVESVTITEPGAFTETTTVTEVSCSGQSDGEIFISLSGGTTPYSYLWSNGSTTSQISGLNTGSYALSITDGNGCSSVSTHTITSNPTYNIVLDSDTICSGDSLLIFGSYQSVAAIYYDSLTSVSGCDSILSQELIVQLDYNFILSSVTICSGDSVQIFGQYENASGMYFDNYNTTTGCDSTFIVELIVHPTYDSVLTDVHICDGDSVLVFGTYQTTSGVYYDSYTSINGCDSIFSVELFVSPTYEATLSPITICEGDSVLIFGHVEYTPGTYSNQYSTQSGCDSILYQELVVLSTFVDTLASQTICDGDSILIFGEYRYSDGVYSDSLSTINGCDSILLQELIVNPTYLIMNSIQICMGDSILLNGMYQTQSGIYSDSLHTTNGCDSVIVTDLAVVNSIEITLNETICEGESYTVGTNVYTSSGSYVDIFTSQGGCDSIVTLNLIVNPTSSTTHTVETCQGDNYTVGNNVYTTTGIYIDTLQTSNGCDSIITTDLLVHPSYHAILNRSICDDDSLLINGIYETTSGTYFELFHTSNGCDSIIEIELMVYPTVTVSNSEQICVGDSLLINGNYENSSGVYTQTLQTSHGCDSTIVTTLSVTNEITIQLDVSICAGDSILINNQYQFNNGVYPDTLTAQAGCDSIVMTNLSILSIDTGVVQKTICLGDSMSINGIYQNSTGIYYENSTSSLGCDSVSEINLVVSNTIHYSESIEICEGDSALINGSYQTSAGTYPQTFTAVAGCDSISNITLIVNSTVYASQTVAICNGQGYVVGGTLRTKTGVYTDTLQSTSGCDSILTTNLIVNPHFETSIDTSACESFVFNGVLLTSSGAYTDSLTSVDGCDSIIVLNLTIEPTINTMLSETACDEYEFNGAVLTLSGTYSDTLASSGLCDSIVTLELTINHSVSSVKQSTICEGDSILLGGTYRTTDGTYVDSLQTVQGCDSVVTTNLLVSTADTCFISSGIEFTKDGAASLTVYPNPTRGNFVIQFNQPATRDHTISIVNSYGALVYNTTIKVNQHTIKPKKLASGVYYLLIDGQRTQKIIVK